MSEPAEALQGRDGFLIFTLSEERENP